MEAAREIKLEKESELRFALGSAETHRGLGITLLSGTAEVFGRELAPNKEYRFSRGSNGAVFTYHGATLRVEGGGPREVYTSTDTPMLEYVGVHGQIESARADAVAFSADGPRVLVCGSTDAGKSSLCRILLSYAVRLGRNPIFVDLDVGQGELTIPGAVSAAPLDRNSVSVQAGIDMSIPLSYFFGHTAPSKNLPVYRQNVERLAKAVNERLSHNAEERAAGIVVNTCGWVEGEGYGLLLHACRALSCDVVLVLGHDRLFHSLKSDLASQPGCEQTTVMKLQRSGGAAERDAASRRRARMRRIRAYFYGDPTQRVGELQPATVHVTFDEVNVWEIGEAMRVAKEMTIQASRDTGEANLTTFSLTKVEPTRALMHSVLSVCGAAGPEGSDSAEAGAAGVGGKDDDATEDGMRLLERSSAGFVVVKSVDVEARTMALMAPCAGKLPGPNLLMGNLKWLEQ
jgi:polyribonucleotide 5'-hydroxyl-kinase